MPSFSTPLSGLNADSQDLSVIANNLANLNTVGYKADVTNFQDLFYQQIGTNGAGNPIQVGVGTQISGISGNFTQGSIETTGVPTDIALEGSGFITLENNGLQEFTRAGDLTVAANGALMTADGGLVQGYQAINGVINTNQTLGAISIPAGLTSPPNATSNVALTLNLNSGTAIAPSPASQQSGTGINPSTVLATGKTLTFTDGTNAFTYSSSQVDQRKAGHLAQAIQVAFQELGVFKASNTKVPLRDADAMPFEKAQEVENTQLTADLGRIVNPMKGILTGAAEAQSLHDAQEAIQKALHPEIEQSEVSMLLRREGLTISLKEAGFYNSGAPTIRPDSLGAISRLVQVLKERPENLRIEGHTDDVPIHNSRFASNWELSSARATEMIRLLITQYGFDPSRLSAAGYAEFHPIAPNTTADGRAQNRRVDIVVLAPMQIPANPGVSEPSSQQSGSSAHVP